MATTRKAKPRKTAQDRWSDAIHLETRLVKTTCRLCARPIWSGHVDGEPTKVERVRLNRAGELRAILLGFKTFQEQALGGRIYRRRPFHIGLGVPRHGYVLAEHRCEHRWAAQHFDLHEVFPSHQGDEPLF